MYLSLRRLGRARLECQAHTWKVSPKHHRLTCQSVPTQWRLNLPFRYDYKATCCHETTTRRQAGSVHRSNAFKLTSCVNSGRPGKVVQRRSQRGTHFRHLRQTRKRLQRRLRRFPTRKHRHEVSGVNKRLWRNQSTGLILNRISLSASCSRSLLI